MHRTFRRVCQLPGSEEERNAIERSRMPLICKIPRKKPVTIFSMVLATFAIRLLEVMFFVGLAGSAVVVLISFVEDFKELFGEE